MAEILKDNFGDFVMVLVNRLSASKINMESHRKKDVRDENTLLILQIKRMF